MVSIYLYGMLFRSVDIEHGLSLNLQLVCLLKILQPIAVDVLRQQLSDFSKRHVEVFTEKLQPQHFACSVHISAQVARVSETTSYEYLDTLIVLSFVTMYCSLLK